MPASELTNRELLLRALFENEIRVVRARFSGSGDSGQIDSVTAESIDDEVIDHQTLDSIKLFGIVPVGEEHNIVWTPSPAGNLGSYQARDFDKRPLTLGQFIDLVVYEELEMAHGGWEIDAGSSGCVAIRVPVNGIEGEEPAIDIDCQDNEPEYNEYDEEEYNDE